jgi:bifunctional non-homologous end joining protein LigD
MLKAFELKPEQAESFSSDTYVFEEKKDGSRDLWVKGNLLSARQVNHNERYRHIYELLKPINAVIDGEMSIPFGNILQLNKKENWVKAKYYVFDILEYDGLDLKDKPLTERQIILKHIVTHVINNPLIEFIPQFDTFKSGWDYVVKNKLEGIMIKKKDSLYTTIPFKEYRTKNWFKVKHLKEIKERVVGFENGSVKGAFILENGGKVSSLMSGVGDIFLNAKVKVYAEIMYQFKTQDNKPFQPRLKKLVDDSNNILWEAGQ